MNIPILESKRTLLCNCGCPYIYFRLHEVKCEYFQYMLEQENKLLNTREVDK
jgi:hypothetical protein